MAIGWHFYKEGVSKVKNPNFTSAPFLESAKGPLAGFFRSMAPEADALDYLDLAKMSEKWNAFRHHAAVHYGFGNEQEIQRYRTYLQRLSEEHEAAKKRGEQNEESFKARIAEARSVQQTLQRLQRQQEQADEIYHRYVRRLEWYLEGDADNREEIQEYLLELERLERAEEDTTLRDVSFRQDWMEEKRQELRAQAKTWISEIDQLQKDFQRDLRSLATPEQRAAGDYLDADSSKPLVDTAVTYLTLAVGALLLVGLFTRVAAVGGAVFLASVIATQPPGFAGSAPTYKEFIELIALLLLAAFSAGRYAGLDFFLHALWTRRRGESTEPATIEPHESHA